MSESNQLPEFRFYYFTNRYVETVAFYRDILGLKEVRSWDRGEFQKGTIFLSPNGTGWIEIEEGNEAAHLQGGLYIEVEDVDQWYDMVVSKNIDIVDPIINTSYGHRSFKFRDPNELTIGLFRYI